MEYIQIVDREINPQVIHTRQFENGVHKLEFTIDDYIQGTVDLRKLKAYAVTCRDADNPDITLLSYTISGRNVIVTWDISAKTLEKPGVIYYLIRFSTSAADDTVKWYSHKGIIVNRESIEVDDSVLANYPTALQQLFDRIDSLTVNAENANLVIIPAGETLETTDRLAGRLYYQVEDAASFEGHFEDSDGHALGASGSKYVVDADLNTLLDHGEYVCAGTLKNTSVTNTYCFLRVTDTLSTSKILQELFLPDTQFSDEVRCLTRIVTIGGSGTTTSYDYGGWTETPKSWWLETMVAVKDFEIECLTEFHSQNLTDIFIATGGDLINVENTNSEYITRGGFTRVSGTNDTPAVIKIPMSAASITHATQVYVKVACTGAVLKNCSVSLTDSAAVSTTLTASNVGAAEGWYELPDTVTSLDALTISFPNNGHLYGVALGLK